jgi:hypothetical protein
VFISWRRALLGFAVPAMFVVVCGLPVMMRGISLTGACVAAIIGSVSAYGQTGTTGAGLSLVIQAPKDWRTNTVRWSRVLEFLRILHQCLRAKAFTMRTTVRSRASARIAGDPDRSPSVARAF